MKKQFVKAARTFAATVGTATMVATAIADDIVLYDTTGGVTDYRLTAGQTMTIYGDALTDNVNVWLNGGTLRVAGDVTIAANITQDVASVIFIEGAHNVRFTGALSVAGAAAGNYLVVTGDVASASSELTFSGSWDVATTKDGVFIQTGSTVFTNGSFVVGGYLTWEAQAGNAVVANDAVIDVSDREGARPSSINIPYYRPFSDDKVLEVRTGGKLRVGAYRQFFVGCGTKEHIGGRNNQVGWRSKLRIAGGEIDFYQQGMGIADDGIYLYGKRMEAHTEDTASIFDFSGGSFSATGFGGFVRYGKFASYPTYAIIKWSGGTWNVLKNYYGSQNFSLTKAQRSEARMNMPCQITGDVTLDLTMVKHGEGVNQSIDSGDVTTSAGNGRWTGTSTSSLTVIGGNGVTGKLTMYSFHPNGMGLVLTDKARFVVHAFDRGEQRYRSLSIASGSYLEVATNVVLTTVGASVPPVDRLLAPQVDVAQDAEGTLGTVRLSLAYGQTEYANASFAPVAGGELYLSDVPEEEALSDYELPVRFETVENVRNLESWTVFANGVASRGKRLSYKSPGHLMVVNKGLHIVFR